MQLPLKWSKMWFPAHFNNTMVTYFQCSDRCNSSNFIIAMSRWSWILRELIESLTVLQAASSSSYERYTKVSNLAQRPYILSSLWTLFTGFWLNIEDFQNIFSALVLSVIDLICMRYFPPCQFVNITSRWQISPHTSGRVQKIGKILEKTQYLMNTLYIPSKFAMPFY